MGKVFKLREIAEFLSAELRGNPDQEITGIAPLDHAKAGQISFLENPSFRKYLATTSASAVILTADNFSKLNNTNALIVAKPYFSYAKLSAWFDDTPKGRLGIHDSVIVGKDCDIDPSVSIAPYVVIGDQVKLGKNVTIGANCVIGNKVEIGDNGRLCSGVTLYHRVKIGKRVLLHSGAVIWWDGFGNANEKGVWHKIYQLGSVIVGDDVEVGANTTIDRGALEDTVIEDGVKLDNQIQIGHNVKIGAHTAIAGCVGIAGSTIIGKHCMIGGGVGISGHLSITDGVILTGMTAVGKSIINPGVYSSGIPAVSGRAWCRILARLNQLEELVRRVGELEKKTND